MSLLVTGSIGIDTVTRPTTLRSTEEDPLFRAASDHRAAAIGPNETAGTGNVTKWIRH